MSGVLNFHRSYNFIQFTSQLKFSDFRLWVKLGVGEQEKVEPQLVSIDITLGFSQAPQAMKTDLLADTFCYFQVAQRIQTQVDRCQPFNLIEYLTGCVYSCLYQNLLELGYVDTQLEVTITKLSPPIENLYGGCAFTYRGSLTQGISDDLYQYWF